MLKTYIFYTMEGWTIAPNGEDVENIQMLGIASGETEAIARANLLIENPWCEAYGFSPDEIIGRQLAQEV